MMNKTDNFIKISKNIPFLSCIATSELEEIERTIIFKKFAKDQVILMEKDQSDFFYIVFSGKVKVIPSSYQIVKK